MVMLIGDVSLFRRANSAEDGMVSRVKVTPDHDRMQLAVPDCSTYSIFIE